MQSRTYLVVGAIAALVAALGIYLYTDGGLRAPSTAEQPMGTAPTAPAPTTPITPGATPGSTR